MEHDSYVAFGPCGHVVGAVVQDPVYQKNVAADVARWIRNGLTVHSKPSAWMREAKYEWCNPECPTLAIRRARKSRSAK